MKKRAYKLQSQFIWLCLLLVLLISAIWLTLYGAMAGILREQAQSLVSGMIAQVTDSITSKAQNIENYADTVTRNQYTQSMLMEKNPLTNYFNVRSFRGTIATYAEQNESLGSLSILSNEHVFLSVGSIESRYFIISKLDEDYRFFDENSRPAGFTGPLWAATGSTSYYAYIRPIYDLNYGARPQEKLGTLLVFNNTGTIDQAIAGYALPEGYRFLVLSADNQVIAGDRTDADPLIAEALGALTQEELQDQATAVRDVLGTSSMIQYKTLPSLGWKVLCVVPIGLINSNLSRINAYCVWFVLLMVLVILFWYFLMYRNFVRPLQVIVGFIEGGSRHLHRRLSLKSRSEVGDLARHINRMLDEIDALLAETIAGKTHVYELELSKKRVELSALQSQINPHFLYNTLDSIKGYGYLCGSREVVEISNAMAYIMRYCIKGDEYVTVAEELRCMQKYMTIIAIRFEDRIRFVVEIDEAILGRQMPRFILQPVLENAIYHGLEPKLCGGELILRGRADDQGVMIFEIQDNGAGIPPERLAELNQALSETSALDIDRAYESRGIGLLNIHNRLKTMYGEGYGVVIESQPDQGTVVRLILPSENGEHEAI